MSLRNNPYYIKHKNRLYREGEIGSKNGFCEFNDLYHGIKAAVMIVYYDRILSVGTIESIIRHFYSVPIDDVDACIKFVVKESKLPPLKVLRTHGDICTFMVAFSHWFGSNVLYEDVLNVLEQMESHKVFKPMEQVAPF